MQTSTENIVETTSEIIEYSEVSIESNIPVLDSVVVYLATDDDVEHPSAAEVYNTYKKHQCEQTTASQFWI
ncbi:hypothetical protein K7432_003892 [Basidiobolus ranarum]|uniref:Uncharacterized protein n=1 Tax=Basidiobolus ranarum TaxID=34480 RepID=A0ABR2W5Q5_9FUNG